MDAEVTLEEANLSANSCLKCLVNNSRSSSAFRKQDSTGSIETAKADMLVGAVYSQNSKIYCFCSVFAMHMALFFSSMLSGHWRPRRDSVAGSRLHASQILNYQIISRYCRVTKANALNVN